MSREYGSYIKPRTKANEWSRHVDPQAMAPYLTSLAGPAAFITYDDAQSTARKVTYAFEVRNLGGVFMWELSGDFDGKKQELMDSMYHAYKLSEKQEQSHGN